MAYVKFERDPKRPGNLNVYIDGVWHCGTPEACLDGEIDICLERGDTYEIPPNEEMARVAEFAKRRYAQKRREEEG